MRSHRSVDIGAQGWKVPIVAGKAVDLALLYHEVVSRGGEDKVTDAKQWKEVAMVVLGSEDTIKHTGTSTLMSKHYGKFLRDYEARYLWGIQELPSQKIMAKVSLPRPNMVDPSAQVEATVLDRKPLMQRSNVVNGTRALPNPGHTSFASLMSTQELPSESNNEHLPERQLIDLEYDSRSEATQDDEPDAPSPAACPAPELRDFPRPAPPLPIARARTAPPLPRRRSRAPYPLGAKPSLLDRSRAPSGMRRREGGHADRGLSEDQLAKLLRTVRAEAAKEAVGAAMRAVQPIQAQMSEMCASMEQTLAEHQRQLQEVEDLKLRLERALQELALRKAPPDSTTNPAGSAAPLDHAHGAAGFLLTYGNTATSDGAPPTGTAVGPVDTALPGTMKRHASSPPRPSACGGASPSRSRAPLAPEKLLFEASESVQLSNQDGCHGPRGTGDVAALVPGESRGEGHAVFPRKSAAAELSHAATPARSSPLTIASPKRATHDPAPPSGRDAVVEGMPAAKEYVKSAVVSSGRHAPAAVKPGAGMSLKSFNSGATETGRAASGGGSKEALRTGSGMGRLVPKKVPAPKPAHWSLPPAMAAEAKGGAQALSPGKKLAPRPQIGGVKRVAEDASSADHPSVRRPKLQAAEAEVRVGNKNLVGLGVEALKGTSGKPSLPPDELQHDVALLQRHRLCSYIENIGETEQRCHKAQEWDDLCFICKDGGEMVICEYGHNGDNNSQQHPGKRRSKLRAKRKCWHAVHKECLGLHKVPEGFWECNRHRCVVEDCDQPPAASCRSCPTSYCTMHTPADIQATGSTSSGDCATRQITCKSCANILSMKPWDQVLQDDKGVSKVSRVVYVSRLAKLPSSKHVEKWQNTIERIRGKSPSEGSVIRKAVVAALGQAIGRTDVQSMLARSLSCYKSCNDACQTKTFALQTLERFRSARTSEY